MAHFSNTYVEEKIFSQKLRESARADLQFFDTLLKFHQKSINWKLFSHMTLLYRGCEKKTIP